ncbi:hypothetical protein [Streptomyces sp. NPDC002088]|uniref:hypothetical protein n=1 Tax=Streptomyces sp. NPDC002088 TaxID=3154665 RepID=UPI0033311B67
MSDERRPTTYVVHLAEYPAASSTDLNVVKGYGQQALEKSVGGLEYDWAPDPNFKSRLRLRYLSADTGRWNSSNYYITTVPVLEPVTADDEGTK